MEICHYITSSLYIFYMFSIPSSTEIALRNVQIGYLFLLNVSIALCSRIGYYNLYKNPYWLQGGSTTMTPNPTTTEKRPLPRMRTIAKALEEISAAAPAAAVPQHPVRE